MFPEVLDLGFATIKGYGLMIGLAIPLAFLLVGIESRRVGLQAMDDNRVWLFFWIAGAFYIGGKAGYILRYPEKYEALRASEGLLGVVREGFVYYGAVMVALPGTLYALFRYKIPWGLGIDTLVFALPIGHALGRVGCFFAGCCYGCHSDVPWAVTFTEGQGLNHEAVHPVQLYEAAASVVIFLYLWLWVRKRPRFPWQVLLTYFALYAVLRFMTEIFRGDGNPEPFSDGTQHVQGTPPGSLTEAQLVSIVMFVVVVPILLRGFRSGRARKLA